MFRKFREEREKRREEQKRRRQEQEKQHLEEKKQRLEEERNKWLTVPIIRDHSIVDPPPSFEELADHAIQRAGPGVEFDRDAVLAYWSNFLFARMAGIMERDSSSLSPSNAIHGLRAIREREDFEPSMLWDYLTMRGDAKWLGFHKFLTEDIQSNGFIEVVAMRISHGDLRDVNEAYRLSNDDAEKVFELGGH